ncbi:unnamed protein product [Ranitomeya imitator]|uniref:Uncharacterized protein n=1 Tax=Ranitomeya imitator TaxID=111125 RepID=A0ABN9M0A2_9NEOB|nr:unnamed protein product [Ranitomeya imitator]
MGVIPIFGHHHLCGHRTASRSSRTVTPSFGHQVIQLENVVIVSAPCYPVSQIKLVSYIAVIHSPPAAFPITIPGSPDDDHISLGLSLSRQEKPLQLLDSSSFFFVLCLCAML